MNHNAILLTSIISMTSGGPQTPPEPTSDNWIHFKPEFTAGNVIQAAAALTATGILAAAMQKRNANKRKEKDILIDDAQLIVDTIAKLQSIDQSAPLIEVTALLKQIQVGIISLRSELVTLKYPTRIVVLLPSDEEIRRIRRLATETPIHAIENHAKSKKCSAAVRDGIISLTEERRTNLEDALHAARRKLQTLRLQLNKK